LLRGQEAMSALRVLPFTRGLIIGFAKPRRFWGCFLLVTFLASAHASDISSAGAWSTSLTAIDLAAGAGSDLRSPIESAAGQVALTISNTAGAGWTVTVSTDGALWPAGVHISVRVASTGSGAGSVSGGGAYLALGGAAQTLLSGTGDRADVQLQFRLEGVSVRNSFGNYSANIVYSLQ
jgi:hypothetical protein